jgi:hypothetical protein
MRLWAILFGMIKMSNQFINNVNIYSPSINFTVARNDNVALSNYQLDWNGKSGAGTNGSKLYTNAYLIPTDIAIKFTPDFSKLNSNNKIIQYKWSFGDGSQKVITDVNYAYPATPPASALYVYNPGLTSVVNPSGRTSLTVTLTAIDAYQRHVRAYKVLYLTS